MHTISVSAPFRPKRWARERPRGETGRSPVLGFDVMKICSGKFRFSAAVFTGFPCKGLCEGFKRENLSGSSRSRKNEHQRLRSLPDGSSSREIFFFFSEPLIFFVFLFAKSFFLRLEVLYAYEILYEALQIICREPAACAFYSFSGRFCVSTESFDGAEKESRKLRRSSTHDNHAHPKQSFENAELEPCPDHLTYLQREEEKWKHIN